MAHYESKLFVECPKQMWEIHGNAHSLHSFHLENNHIRSLPDQMSVLRAQRLISVTQNQISTMPKWIVTLHHLETLGFGSNKLEALPDDLGQLSSLSHLNVYDNRLRQLPISLGACGNLHTIVLGKNMWMLYDEVREAASTSTQAGLPPIIVQSLSSGKIKETFRLTGEFLR